MAEKNDIKTLLTNTKQELAKAEKELINAKKNEKMIGKNLMKVIVTNYQVAESNLTLAKQLAGITKTANSQETGQNQYYNDNQSSIIQTDKLASTASSSHSTAVSAATITFPVESSQSNSTVSSSSTTQAKSDIVMTRHQYREQLKQHHQS